MTPQEIDIWLKKIGKDRTWLAERMAVSPHTARGWFSGGRPIPEKKMARIKELAAQFETDETEPIVFNPSELKVVGTVFPEEMADKISMAAELRGETVEEFVRNATLMAVRNILSGE